MANKQRKLVNSIRNQLMMQEKAVPCVYQRENPSETEIQTLMLHFLGLLYFTVKAIGKCQKKYFITFPSFYSS